MTRAKMLAHALSPKSLDEELKRLGEIHGNQAVREAAERLPLKRGRRAEQDLKILGPMLKIDARNWLEGRELASNYAIAQEFARVEPGHNPIATVRRIQRKLAELRLRLRPYLAYQFSQTDFPYTVNLNVLDELIKGEGVNAIWSLTKSVCEQKIAEYIAKFGSIEPDVTMDEIEKALKPPPLPTTIGGLFNLGGLPNR